MLHIVVQLAETQVFQQNCLESWCFWNILPTDFCKFSSLSSNFQMMFADLVFLLCGNSAASSLSIPFHIRRFCCLLRCLNYFDKFSGPESSCRSYIRWKSSILSSSILLDFEFPISHWMFSWWLMLEIINRTFSYSNRRYQWVSVVCLMLSIWLWFCVLDQHFWRTLMVWYHISYTRGLRGPSWHLLLQVQPFCLCTNPLFLRLRVVASDSWPNWYCANALTFFVRLGCRYGLSQIALADTNLKMCQWWVCWFQFRFLLRQHFSILPKLANSILTSTRPAHSPYIMSL